MRITFSYEKNIHSVTANTRQDGMELLRIAAEIPIRPQVQIFPLIEANKALLALKEDRMEGFGNSGCRGVVLDINVVFNWTFLRILAQPDCPVAQITCA